jgi:exodeoxyribonuclease V alpha subunit
MFKRKSITCNFSGLEIEVKLYSNSDEDYEDDDQEVIGLPTTLHISHSYCMTVHCSQGSEYPFVVYYIPRDRYVSDFLSRKLSFTAISRAKNICICVGVKQTFIDSVKRQTPNRIDVLNKLYKERK